MRKGILNGMQDLALLLIVAVPVILGAVFTYLSRRTAKKLKPKDSKRLAEEISRLEGRTANERIVGYDKVLDHLLTALGYKGTL